MFPVCERCQSPVPVSNLVLASVTGDTFTSATFSIRSYGMGGGAAVESLFNFYRLRHALGVMPVARRNCVAKFWAEE